LAQQSYEPQKTAQGDYFIWIERLEGAATPGEALMEAGGIAPSGNPFRARIDRGIASTNGNLYGRLPDDALRIAAKGEKEDVSAEGMYL
jgi:hypothetical protein